MSRSRQVIALIDQALLIRDRNPTMFSNALQNNRDCLQLSRVFERHRVRRAEPVGGRAERDQVERIRGDVEEIYARRREERYAKRSLSFQQERRETRAELSTLQLHQAALHRAATMTTVAASNIESSRGGTDPNGPPSQQQIDDDHRWREHWQVIRSRLERVHELLDEHYGHATVASTQGMLGAEKDRLVLAQEGLSALAVVELLGSDIAGSPTTVRRIRQQAGRSTLDGRHKDTA